MFQTFLFYALATALLGAAVGVITVRNPVHAALCLILAFVTSAVLWLLLEAEFLAIVLVLVYVGAVMVLFLFVVMMLDINTASLREGFLRYAPVGAVVAGIISIEIGFVVWFRSEGLPVDGVPVPRGADYSSTEVLGQVLYTEYLYPFEIAAMLLLLAIIAAILLTMRRRPGLKVQDVGEQVAVRRSDRVRMVQMKPESE